MTPEDRTANARKAAQARWAAAGCILGCVLLVAVVVHATEQSLTAEDQRAIVEMRAFNAELATRDPRFFVQDGFYFAHSYPDQRYLIRHLLVLAGAGDGPNRKWTYIFHADPFAGGTRLVNYWAPDTDQFGEWEPVPEPPMLEQCFAWVFGGKVCIIDGRVVVFP